LQNHKTYAILYEIDLFKMKTNVIEFFTYDRNSEMIPEPYPAYKNIPKWFSDTPTISRASKCPFRYLADNFLQVDKKVNVKGCPGIIDYVSSGYIVPSWNNFLARNDNGKLYFNWEHQLGEDYTLHESDTQASGLTEEEKPLYQGFHKISTPWYIKTSPGVSCLVTHPTWHREKRFTSVSGVMHTDKSPMPLKWFFEWNQELKNDMTADNITKEQIIEKGTPLILITPFVRSKFDHKINYVTENEMNIKIKYKTSIFVHDWLNKSGYNEFRKNIGKLFK
jgi:hypothetical protein